MEKFGGYKAEVKERIEQGKGDEALEKVGPRRNILEKILTGLNTYLHGPTDYAKTIKLELRVGDLDLPERTKSYISSRARRENMHRCALVAEQKRVELT